MCANSYQLNSKWADHVTAARNDLNNIGGQIIAATSLNASAGRDLNVVTTTSSATNGNFSHTGIDRVAGLYVSNPGGTLVASAGRDANIIAGVISNNASNGSTVISAGNNINLGTVATASSSLQTRGEDHFLRDSQTADVGSQLQTAGNLSLIAGKDLNAKAANVQAGADLTASAGNNVNITEGRQTNSFGYALKTTEEDLFSSSTTIERRTGDQDKAVGSSFGGNTVTVVAGKNINVKGSNIISDTGTTLAAGNNIAIEAAQNTSGATSFHEKTESGLLDGGGAGITVGIREQSTEQKNTGATAAASTVGSIAGNVTLVANEVYKQVGSDVMAPGGDVTIVAKTVDIVEAREASRSEVEQKFKQTGLTLEVTSPIISAMQTIEQMSDAADNTSDGRMKGLAAANAAFAAKNAYNAIQAGQNTTGNNPSATTEHSAADQAGGINIAISIGTSESQSNSTSQSNTARGSNVTASGAITIAATGAGQDSNLTIQGSNIEAGRAVQLLADNQVKLLAAQNTSSQNSTNSNSSGSIGISFGTDGLLLNLSASAGKGRGDGADIFYTNTQVKAGEQVSITSGGDTTLQGAVVKANQVKADVGGNLNIQSLQDTSTYTSQQKSAGGSLSVGVGKMSGSVNASKSNIDSNFSSVGQQSGIKAGSGGFQVSVAGNTALLGSVIASDTQAVNAQKNSFKTGGTLTIADIQNVASYSAKSVSISVGSSQQPTGKMGMSGLGLGLGSDKGDASSTSSAGISGIAGNTAVRSTDAETGLQKIFDADKVQREINAQTQITQAFTREAPKAVASFAASQAAELRGQNNEAEAKKWDEGGIYRIALHTVVGALGGGFDGAVGAAASASSANLMNALQDGIQQGLMDAGLSDSAAKALAQTVATLTAAGIGAAVGGAQGAATAATVDANNRQLHQVEKDLIKKLAKGNAVLEKQLEQIACADTHCAAGKSDSDPVKAELLASEQYLDDHPQEFAEARKIYEAAKAETQLFGYTPSDQRLDAINAGDARSGLYGLTAAELAAKNQATAACGTNKICSDQVASQYNRTASDRSEFNLAIENLVRAANSCIDSSCSKDALKQLSLYRQDIAYQYHACESDACRASTRYAALPLFTALTNLKGQANDPQFLADAATLLAIGFGENAQNGAALVPAVGQTSPTTGNGRGLTNGGKGGAAAQNLGATREQAVADAVGGTRSGEIIKTSRGKTDVDVTDATGNLIAVGGPAKAKNLDNFERGLTVYLETAAARGVNAYFYYAPGTPQTVLSRAVKVLGADFVKPIP